MGLDTTPECFSGPHSQFHRWRLWLAGWVGIPLDLMEGFYGWAWEEGDLDFDRHFGALSRCDPDPERGLMFWDTLQAFRSVGRPIEWRLLGDDPLIILLRHSDCGGVIRWFDCRRLAIRLGQILRGTEDDTRFPKYEDPHPKAGQLIWDDWRNGRGTYDGMVPATKRFIRGLLEANRDRRHVAFH